MLTVSLLFAEVPSCEHLTDGDLRLSTEVLHDARTDMNIFLGVICIAFNNDIVLPLT
jgi:hypothetical protein